MLFHKSHPLKGEITVPGDKSISHRGIMLGALANGTTSITNFLKRADCLSTISCFQKMGIEIEETENEILVHGKGLHGLSAPKDSLYCNINIRALPIIALGTGTKQYSFLHL